MLTLNSIAYVTDKKQRHLGTGLTIECATSPSIYLIQPTGEFSVHAVSSRPFRNQAFAIFHLCMISLLFNSLRVEMATAQVKQVLEWVWLSRY